VENLLATLTYFSTFTPNLFFTLLVIRLFLTPFTKLLELYFALYLFSVFSSKVICPFTNRAIEFKKMFLSSCHVVLKYICGFSTAMLH
jgi:hypothetical protein